MAKKQLKHCLLTRVCCLCRSRAGFGEGRQHGERRGESKHRCGVEVMLLGFANANAQEKPSLCDHQLPFPPFPDRMLEQGSGMQWVSFGPKGVIILVTSVSCPYTVPSVLGSCLSQVHLTDTQAEVLDMPVLVW